MRVNCCLQQTLDKSGGPPNQPFLPQCKQWVFVESNVNLQHLCALLGVIMPRTIPGMKNIFKMARRRLGLSNDELNNFMNDLNLITSNNEYQWYLVLGYFADRYEEVIYALRRSGIQMVPTDESSYDSAINRIKGNGMNYTEVITRINNENKKLTAKPDSTTYSKAFHAICREWHVCYMRNHAVYSLLGIRNKPLPSTMMEYERVAEEVGVHIDALQELARDICCPVAIRYAAEQFLKLRMAAAVREQERQNIINNRLLQEFDSESNQKHLSGCFNAFVNSAKYPNCENPSPFKSAWKRLREYHYNLTDLESFSIFCSEITTDNSEYIKLPQEQKEPLTCILSPEKLKIAIRNLQLKESEKDACSLYEEQKKEIWLPRFKSVDQKCRADDFHAIKQLAQPPKTKLDELCDLDELYSKKPFIRSVQEYEYATAVLTCGNMFKPNVTVRYKQCVWGLHTSERSVFLIMLLDLIEKQWPEYDMPEKIHMYCDIYSTVYDDLSEYCIHMSANEVDSENCQPTEADLLDYLDRLLRVKGEDFTFVASSLVGDNVLKQFMLKLNKKPAV